MGSSKGPQSTSTLTDQQQEVVNSLVNQLLGKQGADGNRAGGMLQTGATPYKGALVAPYLDPNSGMESDALKSILSGKSSYNLDPATTQNMFTQGVVNPALNTFNQKVAPSIKESYAGGGAAFNSRSGDQIAQQLGNLNIGFSSQLAGMQYQDQTLAANLADSAAQRQAGGVQLATALANQNQQYKQQGVTAKYGEFLRTAPENNPWLQTALQLTNQSQMALYQKPSPLGPLMGAFGMGAGALFGGPMGAAIGGQIGAGVGTGLGRI